MGEAGRTGPGGCEACPLESDRREFLRRANLVALGALLGMGIPTSRAFAMRPVAVKARAWSGNNPTYPIPAEDSVQVDAENEVILVRWQNVLYALSLACPHQGTALEWNADDGQFQCPKHDSVFDRDGTYIDGRAPRSMDRFSLTRSGDQVAVDTKVPHQEDEDVEGWKAATLAL